MNYFLAIDIGASSGRHIVGDNEGNLTEVYRFKTGFREVGGHLVNDVETLWQNILEGIKRAFAQFPRIESLAIDTWGVDYVLLDGEEEILPVYAYRDHRTEAVIEEVHRKISFQDLYHKTGIQFQPFNTIYQLYTDLKEGRLEKATDFLMLPEYLSYKLTGVKLHEYTDATTTGFVNAATKEYDGEILSALGLPARLFGKLYQPGTKAGMLKPEIAQSVGGNCNVLLCASHDTASAVEGIPFEEDAPYISSGTWSLLGVKAKSAITDENSRKANYSNEGGVGYTRYQKNIMGMWVVNRLRDELCPEKPFSEIAEEASRSTFHGCVDVNDALFLAPKSMKQAFEIALKTDGLKEEDYFNCAYISLAHSYKRAIEELESNLKTTYRKLYIVGGGAKNSYLNDLTERITKKKVVALAIEATAIGNLNIQRKAFEESKRG